MLAVMIVLILVVVLLGLLTLGLLRSHADILRALHGAGIGVGDPRAADAPSAQPVQLRTGSEPPLPAERSTGIHDIEGVTPNEAAAAVSMSAGPSTLLVFLTSGCSSCASLWASLANPHDRSLLPPGTRIVVVTKGKEWESPAAIATKAPRDVTVVMSTDAWGRYEIPGSPYFILVDGARQKRVGEGTGQNLAQIADMIGRAGADERLYERHSVSRAAADGLNGEEREARNDEILRGANIRPGDPSLYPRSLSDVFAATGRPGPENGEG